MDYGFEILPSLIAGVRLTISIFFVTLILSLPLGILVAWGRVSPFKWLRHLLSFYITIMRGTPLLLQIIFINYGLPLVGIVFTRYTSVVIAFTLNYAAYFAEIFRGGIQSIDRGQTEATIVTGMSRSQSFRYVILPQVFSRTLPSVSNEIITLVKDTSLIYVVGLAELLQVAKSASNRDATLIPYVMAGAIYLLIIIILTKILKRLEGRVRYGNA